MSGGNGSKSSTVTVLLEDGSYQTLLAEYFNEKNGCFQFAERAAGTEVYNSRLCEIGESHIHQWFIPMYKYATLCYVKENQTICSPLSNDFE